MNFSTIQSFINGLTWLHSAFGIGGVGLGVAIANWQRIVAWFKSATGQAVVGDVIACEGPVLDLLKQFGHPVPDADAKLIHDALAQITPPAAPSAPSGPLIPKVAALLIGFLALGMGLHADTPGTSQATYLVPSVFGASGVLGFGPGGSLISQDSSLGGLSETLSVGTLTTTIDSAGTETQTFQGEYGLSLEVGGDKLGGGAWVQAGVGLQYQYAGALVFWDLGTGKDLPGIAILASIPLVAITPWDWKISITW